eukprot:233541-Alexandrium_andersonii.AAC.1
MGPKFHPGRSRSRLARWARRPSPRLGVCRNLEPHFPEVGAGGTAPMLRSALWGAPNFCRL